MNCKSKNVIYALLCETCGKFYVGHTEDPRKRVTLHREDMRHLRVSHHMAECNNGNSKTIPMYALFNTKRQQWEMKEKELIEILQPDLNANL
ncbi:hypothetical protein SNE40_009641 [Patella caerulea]|uniref:GIY-YIG domain-containing protein n=1 Tax=Patella caerulea TaxID=87958 RepID=A0AAN8JVX9_PATCE